VGIRRESVLHENGFYDLLELDPGHPPLRRRVRVRGARWRTFGIKWRSDHSAVCVTSIYIVREGLSA